MNWFREWLFSYRYRCIRAGIVREFIKTSSPEEVLEYAEITAAGIDWNDYRLWSYEEKCNWWIDRRFPIK